MATAQARGAAAEDRAARFLEQRGMRIVERNFRVRGGEIDLVCRDGASLVFVEVRLRSRADYGGAAASITPAKQARLITAARHWLARHGEAPCRFDCVLIDGDRTEWLKDAIAAD
jgi:putative endonuclease